MSHVRRKQIRASCLIAAATFLCLNVLAPQLQSAAGLDRIVYTMRFPAPETHVAEIEAVIPTDKRAFIELMLPAWSPGYYGAGNYARNVQEFTTDPGRCPAHGREAEGQPLAHSNERSEEDRHYLPSALPIEFRDRQLGRS